jgi:hypothetical protein
MRVLFGMILGAAIIIGLAYMRDSMVAPGKPVVNWDVAGSLASDISARVRELWYKTVGR